MEVQIPALRQLCETGRLSIDNIDVFYEKGVFDRGSSARILRAGQEAGWKINFHGDELHPMEAGLVSMADSYYYSTFPNLTSSFSSMSSLLFFLFLKSVMTDGKYSHKTLSKLNIGG